jgi:AcrR family transcriptional regulator
MERNDAPMNDATSKRRRSNKSIQTERDILRHAILLFSQLGYDQTTTKEIAQAAGVSEGTIFTYFATKLDLLSGIMDDYYQRLQGICEQIIEQEPDPYRRLRGLLARHIQFADQEWLIGRVVAQQGRFGNDLAFLERFYQHNKRYSKLYLATLDELKASGRIRATIPTTLIRDALFGTFEHIAVRHYLSERDYHLDVYLDQLMDIVFFGCAKAYAADL